MKFDECFMELKEIFKLDPKKIEKELINLANEHVGFFEDANFRNQFRNHLQAKEEALRDAILDISAGADLLKSGQIGVVFNKDKFEKYYTLHGEQPEGSISFSIFLKKFKAFSKFRETEADELDQELLNIITYRLIAYWSQL